jgi:hypothetical protein
MRSHLARWARLTGMSGDDPLFDGRAPAAFASQWAEARAHSQRYLQRRRDSERLALHLAMLAAMALLTAWWVIPHHAFSGRTLYIFSPGRGIHVGDLPAAAFVLIGLVSGWSALRSLDRLTSTR